MVSLVKIFAAGGPQTETNTFCSMPTTMEMFKESYLAFKGDDKENSNFWALPNQIWAKLAHERGYEYIESLRAGAEPAGPVEQPVYEKLRNTLLADLKEALPVDMVLLNLHGAMIAEHCLDCEADILTKIRALVGRDVPIGVELDLHANISDKTLALADIVVLFKEYPHTDVAARAHELFDLAEKTALRKITPITAVANCHIIGLFPTQLSPMKEFMATLKKIEQSHPDILSISVAHGFPWGDSPNLDAKIIVITNNNALLAKRFATSLAYELYSLREALKLNLSDIGTALEKFKEHSLKSLTPMTFGDFADNPGGGGIGDATFILQACLDAGVVGAAFLTIWDPQVVEMAFREDCGAEINVSVGGKCGRFSGPPVVEKAKVESLSEAVSQNFEGSLLNLGRVAALSIKGNLVLVNSIRCQIYSHSPLSDMGFHVDQFKLFVVKSAVHFEAQFSQLGPVLKVNSPGALNIRFEDLEYKYAPKNLWPFNKNFPTLIEARVVEKI